MLRDTLISLVAVAAFAACSPGAPAARPSVILVSIDTLRADHLGLYGYERDTSPFLDRFAQDCIVFENAFTPWSWTLIAHMTMLTGLLPIEHGVIERDLALSPEIPTLAEDLQAAGYQTVGLYFSGWVHERHGFSRGFDIFRAHRSAEKAGEHLKEALRVLDPERPYFLFLHLFDVHSAPFEDWNRTVYVAPPPHSGCFLTEASAPLPDVPAREIWESEQALEPAQIETLVAHYDSAIRHVDASLEACFGELERGGWLDDTLVIVTADHGESLGQRGQVDEHGFFFQEGLRVPLLLRQPNGQRAGERSTAPVHLADIAPTILASAGLRTDPLLGGRSLLAELPAERVLTGSRRRGQSYIVQWPRKLVHLGKKNYLEFDLAADPDEAHPLRSSEKEFSMLLQAARGGRGPYPAPIPIGELSAEDSADLQALGYGGEDDDQEPR